MLRTICFLFLTIFGTLSAQEPYAILQSLLTTIHEKEIQDDIVIEPHIITAMERTATHLKNSPLQFAFPIDLHLFHQDLTSISEWFDEESDAFRNEWLSFLSHTHNQLLYTCPLNSPPKPLDVEPELQILMDNNEPEPLLYEPWIPHSHTLTTGDEEDLRALLLQDLIHQPQQNVAIPKNSSCILARDPAQERKIVGFLCAVPLDVPYKAIVLSTGEHVQAPLWVIHHFTWQPNRVIGNIPSRLLETIKKETGMQFVFTRLHADNTSGRTFLENWKFTQASDTAHSELCTSPKMLILSANLQAPNHSNFEVQFSFFGKLWKKMSWLFGSK